MRYTIIILLTIISASCRIDPNKSEWEANDADKKAIVGLLAKFREAKVDTLEIYSTDDLEKSTFAFRGTKLDSVEISILPKKMRDRFYDKDFYACYRFTLDSSHIGLIIRTPSEYSASSIKLFVLDSSRNHILESFIELAESTGDAGYSLTKTSLIIKEGDKINYLIWQHDSEDMSVENENDTTIVTSDSLHLVTFKKDKFDTVDSNWQGLILKYKELRRRVE